MVVQQVRLARGVVWMAVEGAVHRGGFERREVGLQVHPHATEEAGDPVQARLAIPGEPVGEVVRMQNCLAVRRLEAADGRTPDAGPQHPSELGAAGEADHAAIVRAASPGDVEDLPVELVDAQPLGVAGFHQQTLVETALQGRVEPGAERDGPRRAARDQEIWGVAAVGRQPDHRAADRDHLPHDREVILQLIPEGAAPDGVLGLVEPARDDVGLVERGVEDVLHVPEDLDDAAGAARAGDGGEGGPGGIPAFQARPVRDGSGRRQPTPSFGPRRGQVSKRRQVRREARDLDYTPAVLVNRTE